MNGTTSAGCDLVSIARVRRLAADGQIRPIREGAHIHRSELAEAVGTSTTTVMEWERGAMPRREHALRLARVLDQLAAVAASV